MTSTQEEHESWTSAGSDTAAKDTYASVRAALSEIERRRSVEVFLQGSYANTTNIRADSDVDIVVMTRQTFKGAVDRLNPFGLQRYSNLPDASFSAEDLRNEVFDALVSYYGASRVHHRTKCIKVDKVPGYVDADVVPCVQYRWYRESDSLENYVEGISINPLSGESIVNFPKEHRSNGQAKNALCGGTYKATVRQMKRLRNRAVLEGRLWEETAPGYLLECMTYNVPDREFVADDSDRLLNVLAWLRHANKQLFLSCDRIHHLFETDPGDFDVDEAQSVVDALWDAY